MGLFVRDGLICGDFMSGEIRYFRIYKNIQKYLKYIKIYKIYDRKINMCLFVRDGLICRDFMSGELRYFRTIGKNFLVHSRKFVSVKLQKMFAFLSSRKFLDAIPSHLTD